ncbi:MAG: lmo0937 family membrane protein [Chthoniobacterales bacterium]
MLITIGLILLVLYLLGLFAFHVTAGLIHIVVVVAVIMIILHFVRGSRV